MSIMPLLPTRLVSNLCFRIYTKKSVGVIHLCSSRHLSLACSQVKNEKHAEAHAYMTTTLAPKAQRENCLYTQASTAASHDLGVELRVQVSIKALVNAYSNIYVRKASLSARFPFRRCKDSENPSLSVQFLGKKNEFDAKNWRFRRILRKVELLLIARVSLCRLLAHSDGTFLYLRKTKYSKCYLKVQSDFVDWTVLGLRVV